jgi:hypothetical protein
MAKRIDKHLWRTFSVANPVKAENGEMFYKIAIPLKSAVKEIVYEPITRARAVKIESIEIKA